MAAADPSSSRGASTRAAQRAWSQCIVLVLNTWAAAPQSTNRNPDDYRCFEASASKNLCPAQTAALAHFDLMTNQFVHLWKNNKVKPRDWTELLTRRLDSYAGMVTTKAHDVCQLRASCSFLATHGPCWEGQRGGPG